MLLRLSQPVFSDEPSEAETGKNVIQRVVIRRLDEHILKPCLNGRVAPYGRKVIAQKRRIPARLKLPFDRVLYIEAVKLRVYFTNGSKPPYQLRRGLLPDSRDSRYVVARIAHEGLQVDYVNRLEAVFLSKRLLVVDLDLGLTQAAFDMVYLRASADELERVAVARHKHAASARLACSLCYSAEKVVRLPALQLVAAHVHRVQHLLEYRHLDGELVRHTLALSLILLVLQLAEGRTVQIEGDGESVRTHLVHNAPQDAQKAVDSVRRSAVGSVQHSNAEKRPVHYAVAVNNHYGHGVIPLSLKLSST